ncbi:MAG: NUDIX domain-containing protein [Candidatus Aenigmarchaeota archaeon]|nr:NUDIX domain-containing protein [Candidatus Aenigmarchaeota archaeon]
MRRTAIGILLKNNKILLTKRSLKNTYSGLWSLPGGHIKPNESLETALKREMKEELEIDIRKFKFLMTVERIDPTSNEHFEHNLFIITDWVGDIKESIEQKEINWFNINKLPKNHSIKSDVLDKLKEELINYEGKDG